MLIAWTQPFLAKGAHVQVVNGSHRNLYALDSLPDDLTGQNTHCAHDTATQSTCSDGGDGTLQQQQGQVSVMPKQAYSMHAVMIHASIQLFVTRGRAQKSSSHGACGDPSSALSTDSAALSTLSRDSTSPATSASSSPRQFLHSPTFGGSLTPLDQRLASLPWPTVASGPTSTYETLALKGAGGLPADIRENAAGAGQAGSAVRDAGAAGRAQGGVADGVGGQRQGLAQSSSLPDIQACLQLDLSGISRPASVKLPRAKSGILSPIFSVGAGVGGLRGSNEKKSEVSVAGNARMQARR
jgi:hypothetical protein